MRAPIEWSIALRGDDAARLDDLAAARDRVSPDAFGPIGHAPRILAEAVSAGLPVVAAREPSTSTSPPPKVTEAGAPSALLTPALADRVGWRLDSPTIPAAVWDGAEGRSGLSTGERAMLAIGVGFYNGARSGVDVATLALLDAGNLRRLASLLEALAEGRSIAEWAARVSRG